MTSQIVLIGLGPAEIIVILVVAFVLLVVLGPKNLPKLGNSIGKGIKGLRKGMSDDDKKDEEVVVEAEEVKTQPKKTTTKKATKSTTAKKSGSTTKKKVVKKSSK